MEGHYLIIRPGRVDIPVKIWFGAPLDPETNEPMDRSFRWQIQVGFHLVDDAPFFAGGIKFEALSDIWPRCARWPTDAADYAYRIERASWAAENDPNDAHARIGGRIDPMTCTLP